MRPSALAADQSREVIVGRSLSTVRLRAELARVAPYATSVLITGPSGAGKELVARQIHARSPRAREPFIPVDCASMTGELMASQLFGHVAGAFTGANCAALGCFRAAHRGTIFLDEIGELEYPLQAKLLRVLQERAVTPVGSHRPERIDVRIVAATNRDLSAEAAVGRFREDLYYRLHVVQLRTTALRERADDVPDLARAFLVQLAAEGLPMRSLSPESLSVLAAHDWPGNVRQLRNVLEQAAIDSESPVIEAALVRRIISASRPAGEILTTKRLPTSLEASADSCESPDSPGATESHLVAQDMSRAQEPASEDDASWPSLAHVERRHLVRTLEYTFYNRSAAARLLGVTRQSLIRLMKRHAVVVPDDR